MNRNNNNSIYYLRDMLACLVLYVDVSLFVDVLQRNEALSAFVPVMPDDRQRSGGGKHTSENRVYRYTIRSGITLYLLIL